MDIMIQWAYLELFIFITVGLYTWLWIRSRRPISYPPGPTPLPLIGNFYNISDGDFLKPVRDIRKKHGDIFSMSLGTYWVIVVNGADNIRELLNSRGEQMLDRPPIYILKLNDSYGIPSASGRLWKEHRTFALNKLKSFGFGKRNFESRIIEEVEVFLDSLKGFKENPVDLRDIINISISNNVMSIVIGRRFDYDDPKFKYYIDLLGHNFRNLEVAGVLAFLPEIFTKIPGDPFGAHKLDDLSAKTREFYINEVKEHKEHFDDNNINDFIDAFIKEMRERKDEEDTTFTDKQLTTVVGDLFPTGTETTSTTIMWAILYLIRNKHIQDKMHQEIVDVVGHSRLPNMADKPHLPYCEAVIIESLRLGNIVPFAIPYYVTEDFEYKGYMFPKGAIIFLSIDSALSSEETFPNSDEFNPDRFIDADGNLHSQEKILAFSAGRRVCLGESLARMELFLYLTSMVQRYEFLSPEGQDPPSTKGHLGITRTPLPYDCRAVLRS
ncbi:cytochrome P450, family 2, subfamily J [Mytilus galloprovincialis]|uniref:Cytochrome P450, family 2, subfamily J n=1 Tax=Mytilus galloprovincialis TaxID=29158 RepID=A0A8B6HK06_MYTGA|nr:cytochrome P450, family 2, subfamily J [Mytilus galloprovincialis]